MRKRPRKRFRSIHCGCDKGTITGHLACKVSRVCSLFLRWGGTIECTVTGCRKYSAHPPFFGMKLLQRVLFYAHLSAHVTHCSANVSLGSTWTLWSVCTLGTSCPHWARGSLWAFASLVTDLSVLSCSALWTWVSLLREEGEGEEEEEEGRREGGGEGEGEGRRGGIKGRGGRGEVEVKISSNLYLHCHGNKTTIILDKSA